MATQIRPSVESLTLEQARSLGVKSEIQKNSPSCYGLTAFEITVPSKHGKHGFVGAYVEQPWESGVHRELLYAKAIKDQRLLAFCPWPTKALLVVEYGHENTGLVMHQLEIALNVAE